VEAPAVERVEISAYRIPTETPEADGTLRWSDTTLLVADLQAGDARGLGLGYADAATARLARDVLAPAIEGRSALAVNEAWLAMQRAVRNLGRGGIAAMGISLLDVGLWDLKARLLGLPLVDLLGAVRDDVATYASGGFTSYATGELQRRAAGWAEAGFRMAKMKVGSEPERDPDRVAAVRQALGPDVALFVDANGAYSRRQALWLARAFAEQGVCWFEEPVSSDDREGLRLLRDRAPAGMEIAAGEYGYDAFHFRDLLAGGCVDVLQADATRCLGVTGFLRAGALCEAFCVPLSAHTAPGLHVHLGCALPAVRHVEFFHDHARIEAMLFDGAPQPRRGRLAPDRARPGLGLELRREEAKRFGGPLEAGR